MFNDSDDLEESVTPFLPSVSLRIKVGNKKGVAGSLRADPGSLEFQVYSRLLAASKCVQLEGAIP